MELVSLAQEGLHSLAEYAASYKIGQIALRNLDRALWVVEKCARWAVPPPLDQDDRPQPELVRPLPWVFFLMMLIALRVTRESISIVNLIMGKPPLRSADVVMYIQSKRRYLRTLKYQGNRIARARSSNSQPRDSWYSSVRSLFEFTMCFRKASVHYGNNNSTSVSNNDEVLVVKHGKAERESTSPVSLANAESTMERLIEKMMVDLNADSDEDSCYTITTITTPKSERSEGTVESDQENFVTEETPTKSAETPEIKGEKTPSGNNAVVASTPEKKGLNAKETPTKETQIPQKIETTPQKAETSPKKVETTPQKLKTTPQKDESTPQTVETTQQKIEKSPQKINNGSQEDKAFPESVSTKKSSKKEIETPMKDTKINSSPEKDLNAKDEKVNMINSDDSSKVSIAVTNNSEKPLYTAEEHALTWEKIAETQSMSQINETQSMKEDSISFLQHERSQPRNPRTPKNEQKMANGRTIKSVPSKKKGGPTERRDINSSKSASEINTF